jgi:hypothetical protein
MSVALDEMPTNPGLTLPNPMLVYILDAEGDIEIFEVDFIGGGMNYYATLSKAFVTQGNPNSVVIDCEIVYISNLPPGKPMPPHNLVVVMSYDTVAMVLTFDAFAVQPGLDVALPIYSNQAIASQIPHRMDVDEGTGEIYLLHDSIAAPGTTAVSVYPY